MPEFKNKKYKNSSQLCEAILKETGVAMLPGSDFGFKKKKMLTRLSYTDFDETKFLREYKNLKFFFDSHLPSISLPKGPAECAGKEYLILSFSKDSSLLLYFVWTLDPQTNL